MVFISIILTIFAVTCYSFFINSFFDIKKGLLPFVVISGSMVVFCLFGYANLLFVAGILFYLLAVLCLILTIRKHKKTDLKQAVQDFLSVDILIFITASVLITLVLTVNQPMFTRWDEFSFWGTASNITKTSNQLFSFSDSTFTGKLGYPAGLAALTYIFQFLSPEFSQYGAMAAYDVLAISCFTAVVSVLDKKHYKTAVLLFATVFSFPVMLELINANEVYLYAYKTVYSEMPLGVLFAGSMAVYFIPKVKNLKTFIPYLVCISALSMVKDVGFVLAVISVFCVGIDMLFVQRKSIKLGKVKGFLATVIIGLTLLISTAISFFSWSWHVQSVTGVQQTDVGGETQLSMGSILLNGIKELFGIERTDRFSEILNNMINAFFNEKVISFGSGILIVVMVVLILAFSMFCLRKNKILFKTVLVFMVTSIIGLIGMMVFQLFAYVYVFSAGAGIILVDYGRYLSVYYLGFMIMAVLFLAMAVQKTDNKKLARTVVLVFFTGFIVFNVFTLQNTSLFVDDAVNLDDDKQVINARAEIITQTCTEENDKVYIISQGDNSEIWYQYAYQTIPVHVEVAVGGRLVSERQNYIGDTNITEIEPDDFCDVLLETQCNYLFLDIIDEYVEVDLIHLFEDNLQSFYNGDTRVYNIVENNGKITFTPNTDLGVK